LKMRADVGVIPSSAFCLARCLTGFFQRMKIEKTVEIT